MNRFVKTAVILLVGLVMSLFANPSVGATDDCCPPLASSDSPVRYFDGNSFSFMAPCPSMSCYPSYAGNGLPNVSTSYYTPGFYSRAYAAKNMTPPVFSFPNAKPWPYFYTPAGDYTPGYYSYYYTPGYFRY